MRNIAIKWNEGDTLMKWFTGSVVFVVVFFGVFMYLHEYDYNNHVIWHNKVEPNMADYLADRNPHGMVMNEWYAIRETAVIAAVLAITQALIIVVAISMKFVRR